MERKNTKGKTTRFFLVVAVPKKPIYEGDLSVNFFSVFSSWNVKTISLSHGDYENIRSLFIVGHEGGRSVSMRPGVHFGLEVELPSAHLISADTETRAIKMKVFFARKEVVISLGVEDAEKILSLSGATGG